MNCANQACKNEATHLGKWRVKGKGLCYFYVCEGCMKAKTSELRSKNVHFVYGPSCPCCHLGQTMWIHRDRGICYRCNGEGILGKKIIFKGDTNDQSDHHNAS